jgi:hypothetical protein
LRHLNHFKTYIHSHGNGSKSHDVPASCMKGSPIRLSSLKLLPDDVSRTNSSNLKKALVESVITSTKSSGNRIQQTGENSPVTHSHKSLQIWYYVKSLFDFSGVNFSKTRQHHFNLFFSQKKHFKCANQLKFQWYAEGYLLPHWQ